VTALGEAGAAAESAAAAATVACALWVTVTNVVAAYPQLTATGEATTGAAATEPALARPRVEAATLVPVRSSAVKLEKP
jgi:hypothetical protein